MRWFLLLALLVSATAHAAGTSVVGSKHDLSVTGPGPIRAQSETRVCIFCHVSHGGRDSGTNRKDPGYGHRPYESSTLRGRVGTPSGVSRICLSCHDGTIALGDTVRGQIAMNGAAPGGRIPADRRSNVGTDLRRTHPISIAPSNERDLKRPAPGSRVHLDLSGQVQCTSCHDPHSEFGGSPEGRFLVAPSAGSVLCGECHVVASGSSHQSSGRTFGLAQGNSSGFASVGQAGCEACHAQHGADPRGRLVARDETEAEDVLCLKCHDGSASRVNVERDLTKPSSHAIDEGRGHAAAESPSNAAQRLPESSAAAPRHAACADCHDPHEANDRRAAAPAASGPLAGVWGIDQDGRRVAPVTFEYQICFKCHGDSANNQGRMRFGVAVRRAAADPNLRRVFAAGAPSSHPVVAPARNADVPSLVSSMGPGSLVYCTDCHASDTGPGAGGSGARGPHGSIYAPLLERNYITSDRVVESPISYALCYKCHDREILLSDRSGFRLHGKHVVGEQTPCSACHSAHGVSSRLGSPTANAHLIDFDVTIVQPGTSGRREYRSNGRRSGSCTLSCHGAHHDALAY